ncbi:ribosomal maturation YjgA family protein [Telluribacter humicola]|uniref:ribosomal maturation YjgA family protein n=1 Tax=Telluribacter humicola TaxID=1720261 RepID=UPI001A95A91B|nr:DUF2809 domain-containing protein [Telluribacter humicola]
MFTFRKKYVLWAIALFIIEVIIAKYLKDPIIRPCGGDFLVVILVYCVVRGFINVPVLPAAIGSLGFAYLVESLQYGNLVEQLGIQHHRLALLVLGHQFEWLDMLAYTLGTALVLVLERPWRQPKVTLH